MRVSDRELDGFYAMVRKEDGVDAAIALDLRDERALLREAEECEIEGMDSDGYCLTCGFPVRGQHGDSCGLMLFIDVCERIRQHLEGSDE